MLRDSLTEYIEQRRLSGSSTAADEKGLAAANLFGKELRERPRKRAARDEVFDSEFAARKLADNQRRRGPRHRRDDGRKAAAVRELRVEDWIILVQLFPEPVSDNFEAGAQLAGVEGNAFIPVHDAIPLVPPGRIRIAHDLADAVIQQ